MPIVRGCNLPDDLLYDVDNHTWYQELGDGTVRVGMTAVATALAGELVAFTPKKIGREVKAGKSCATIESGKWVGPARSAADGEVVAVNAALVDEPKLANRDPYELGWMIVLKPVDWEGVRAALTPGVDVTSKYEAKMDADAFDGCAAVG
ncbi:MAG: glycine cleavage system protein H [Gammaproteobacteria bacterium]